jgi:hypothetical protein
MKAFLFGALLLAGAPVHAEPLTWGSVYTSVAAKDCVEISKSNDRAEIDFSEAECPSYGGYRLHIGGGDLRYHPDLQFGGAAIELALPGNFHDMGGEKVEWLYTATRAYDGSGTLDWRALIFRLNVDDAETGKRRSLLYVVRLNGAKSCVIGSASSNDAARTLAHNLNAPCQ